MNLILNNTISYTHLPSIGINLLSINYVLTVIPEYYLATAILSMAIFFSVLKAQESKHTATTILQDGKLRKFNFFSSVNYLAILIVFFYILLSIKQNFICISDVVSFNRAIQNDFISLLAKVIIGVSSLAYLVFVQQFLSDQKLNYFEYYILILTSILGFCLLCCSDDLLSAYLAIEMQSLSFYVLASFKRNSSHSVESGVKYFILGSFSTIMFLFGSNLIYGLTGSISIVDFKDLFIWVFSANSFFLSFESISNALESFQDKTFTKSNNYSIQTLQAIYDKFLILKSNPNLNLFDFKYLLLTFGIIETEIQVDGTLSEVGKYVDELHGHIFQKMVIAKDEINNSFYFNNEDQTLKYYRDLVTDNLAEKSSVWFMADMQALGIEYEDTLDFKQDLYSINSYSYLLNKFKYNWFFIENPTHYNNNFEFSCQILTKSQAFREINEFFYFNHLSHSLDMAKKISKPITSVDNFDSASQNLFKFNDKLALMLEKLKLLGYVSAVDANLILSEIEIMLDTRHDKLEEIGIYHVSEVDWYKTFSEILIDNFKKNPTFQSNCELCRLTVSDSTVALPEICDFLKLFPNLEENKKIDTVAKVLNLRYSKEEYNPENFPELLKKCSCIILVLNEFHLSKVGDEPNLADGLDKNILCYFNIVANFILGSIKNRDIYVDSDLKNFVIDEDLKLNYEYERLNHLKTIAKKFELFGSNTTLSLQEAKSIFLNSKDLLISNFYTLEKANLYKTIAENMRANLTEDPSFFSSRIERLKDSNEFPYLIYTFKSSLSELGKVLDGISNALAKSNENNIIPFEDTTINLDLLEENFSFKLIDSGQELANSNCKLTLVNKFYDLNSADNILLAYINKLINIDGEMNLCDFSLIEQEKYYSIYEKCINGFRVENDDEFLCTQIIDNNVVDLLTSKKNWVLNPEIEYYNNILIVFAYVLYYLEPSRFFDNFDLSKNNVDLINDLNFILHKLETFNGNTHFSLKEVEALFLLLDSDFKNGNIHLTEITDICGKISQKMQDLFSERTSCDNNSRTLKLNSLKRLKSFEDFRQKFADNFFMLSDTLLGGFCSPIISMDDNERLLFFNDNRDILFDYLVNHPDYNHAGISSCSLIDQIKFLSNKISKASELINDSLILEIFCSEILSESTENLTASKMIDDLSILEIFYSDLLSESTENLIASEMIDDLSILEIFYSDLLSELTKQATDCSELKKDLVVKQNYEDLLKHIAKIINRLPHFLSSNEIYDNFSLLPRYLSREQKHGFLNLILFRLKNFDESFFLTKWEFELLVDEMKNIYHNVADLEKQKLYLELSKTLDPTSSAPCLDVIYSKVNLAQSDDYRELAKNRQSLLEIINYYFSVKDLLLDSDIRHEVTAMTLSSIYLNENMCSLDNVDSDVSISTSNNQFIFGNFNQNDEQYLIKFANIVSLFPLFFDFSYSSGETSGFTFDAALIELGVLIVLISLFFKLALSPFHLWSPDVYEGSPSSSTFFFTVISKLSIFVFLLKICYVSFYSLIIDWQLYSLIVAIISIIVGSIGGLKQRKFKSILAYSSISNMGLILISFSAGNFEGIKAFFYYFIIYIISGLAIWSIFLLLKLKKKIPSEKHNKDLGDFSLLQESNVILAYASVITIFTMSGIPPMVGFLAKVSVFLSLTEASMYFVALISILSSVIATFFYIRVLKVIFFENVLVGKLFYPTNSKDNIIRSILFFLMLFLFVSPVLPSFFAYKTTLFLNKNFY